MKMYLSLLLIVSISSHASELADALVKLKDSRAAELAAYKEKNPEWPHLPNDEYEKFYTAHLEKELSEELKLNKELCKENCLTDKEIKAKEAQVRVAVMLIKAQNKISKQKLPKEEAKKVLTDIERSANIGLCASHNLKCDELSAIDKKAADLEKKRIEELAKIEADFKAANPDWENNKADKAVKDHLVNLELQKLEKRLALMDELCKDKPDEVLFCLTPEKKAEMKLEAEGMICRHERVHLLHTLVKTDVASLEEKLVSDHQLQWKDLVAPKDCSKLLEQDRVAFTPKETPKQVVPAVPAETEDKDPKNYDAESCEWVSDMPRRIHYGPSCGRQKARICVGYVVCKQKTSEAKFIRASTCAPEFCGGSKHDAVACTKQQPYFSRKARDSKEFVSPALKKVLSGGTAQ